MIVIVFKFKTQIEKVVEYAGGCQYLIVFVRLKNITPGCIRSVTPKFILPPNLLIFLFFITLPVFSELVVWLDISRIISPLKKTINLNAKEPENVAIKMIA